MAAYHEGPAAAGNLPSGPREAWMEHPRAALACF